MFQKYFQRRESKNNRTKKLNEKGIKHGNGILKTFFFSFGKL